jgi:hypothetical protein
VQYPRFEPLGDAVKTQRINKGKLNKKMERKEKKVFQPGLLARADASIEVGDLQELGKELRGR